MREHEVHRERPDGGELPAATGLEALGLTSRARNTLIRHGIDTLGQLAGCSVDELRYEVIGLGEGTLTEIQEALAKVGLSLPPGRPFKYGRPYAKRRYRIRALSADPSSTLGPSAPVQRSATER